MRVSALVVGLALPASAAGSYSGFVDCTKNWWDAGKEVTAKTTGKGEVVAWSPNVTHTVDGGRTNSVTARANDPSVQRGTVGGSAQGGFESGKTYCWW